MKFALAGNPNCGKTTMYNALTGASETVGNWSGVTVDKKERSIKIAYSDGVDITAVDLPGAYSISPYTKEESITSDFIMKENPDVIINIVDSTNLSRSLFLTTELLELGIPVVVALNKFDATEKKETKIDLEELSRRLNVPVVETVSTSGKGLDKLVETALSIVGKKVEPPFVCEGDKKDAQKKRFEFVKNIVSAVETRFTLAREKNIHDKIDSVIINKWVGIPIFAVVMFLVFWISQAGPGVWISEGYEFENGKTIPGLVTLLESFKDFIAGYFEGVNPLLYSLLIDGVIGGVIAVVGFLPLVMVMYFLIALLEDSGYMARVSVVLDPIFKKVGLSGKSVIPFVIGTGCAVPGVMASRTIRDERERRATAMIAPFMPCGAKLPVISLFAGAFFSDASWVGPLMYFVGIIIIFFSALVINKITNVKNKTSFFIIELPEYKMPSFWFAFKSMCSRGWSYVVKAATVILLCNTAVHIMQTFNWSFKVAETADTSILASVAQPFAYILLPIVGVLSWQLAAAAITGFIAKENVVGTLAVCFIGLENLIDAEALSLAEGSGAEVAGVMAITKVAALAYLMFNLYSPPCFAAIAAMGAEMKSAKWTLAAILFQLAIGFSVSYFVYTVGTLIISPESLAVIPALFGFFFVLIFILVLFILSKRIKR